MRRIIRGLGWALGGLLLLLSLGLLALKIAAHSKTGRTALERAVSSLSAEQVVMSGLAGDLLGAMSIGRIALNDAGGTWLTMEGLVVHWRPSQLLKGEISIGRLHAQQLTLTRQPMASEPKTSSELSLPFDIHLRHLTIEQATIAPSLAGAGADFNVQGELTLTQKLRGEVRLDIRRLHSQDRYDVQASLRDETLHAAVTLQEAAKGPLATFAGLRNQGALNLAASLDGPLRSIQSQANVKVDGLHAQISGAIDAIDTRVDLLVKAAAPAMQLRHDLAWQSLALDARLQGPLNRPQVDGSLQVSGLAIDPITLNTVSMKLKGTDGQVYLEGELARLQASASTIDWLKGVPLTFKAQLDVGKPDYPMDFKLKHPLLAATGYANLAAGQPKANIALTLPDISPIGAISGMPMAGSGKLTLAFSRQGSKDSLDAKGLLAIKGPDKLAKLLGESTKIEASMESGEKGLLIASLQVNGKALGLSAGGALADQKADFHWQAQLNDLSAIIPASAGNVAAQGLLTGPMGDLALSADLKGKLAQKGYSSGPVSATLQLKHLPDAPNGRLKLAGELLAAPVSVQLAVKSAGDNSIHLVVDKADWKSAHAQGGLVFTPDGAWPDGKLNLNISRLADLRPLLDLPLYGKLNATLESVGKNKAQPQAKLTVDAQPMGLADIAAVTQANLQLTVNDPLGLPKMKGLLALNDVSAGKLKGAAQIKLGGTLDALRLQVFAGIPLAPAGDVKLSSALLLNMPAQVITINQLQANGHAQTLKMLAPTKIAFSNGLVVDRLRLGWQQAELELGGRFSPALAMTAKLHQAPAMLLSLFDPAWAMNGTLQGDAQLNGSLAQPTGLIRFNAQKLQMQQGTARALPPAQMTAFAHLQGEAATVEGSFEAGNHMRLKVAGQVPLADTGLFDLQSQARLDLRLLDPILNAGGQRASGQASWDAKLNGTWQAPVLTGEAQLNQGGWQDYAIGMAMTDISALLVAQEGMLRLTKLQAKAGPGTLMATGTLGLSAEFPLKMALTARNARPLASDHLNVNLDADVGLDGHAAGQLTAAGQIRINRAEIRIPERMPTSIPVLKFDKAAQAKPAKEKGQVALDLAIAAPREIFIRGRGLFAELGGKVHVSGTASQPQPDGELKLRKGQFTVAGKTLTFQQGSVGFDNNDVTNPSLNFVANSIRNDFSASLAVTGSAQQPKIELSSTPPLPQDEILANLLFGKGTNGLDPLELVQIASTLASLTGVTGGISDPLEGARKRLSLDRLSVNGASSSLEAGRYIAPGVYLGAKQGISGTPQATLQIDVTKRLKLEGTVGSGSSSNSSNNAVSNGNSVGVIYEYEY